MNKTLQNTKEKRKEISPKNSGQKVISRKTTAKRQLNIDEGSNSVASGSKKELPSLLSHKNVTNTTANADLIQSRNNSPGLESGQTDSRNGKRLSTIHLTLEETTVVQRNQQLKVKN